MQEFPIAKVTIDGRQFWHDIERDKLLPVVRGGDGPEEEAPAEETPAEETPAEETPEGDDAETVDITTLSDEDLTSAGEALEAQFAELFDSGSDPTAEQVAEMAALADQIEDVRNEVTRRAEQAEQNRADAEAIAARVRPPVEEGAPVSEEVSVAAAATVPAEDVLPKRRRLNLSLAEIQARAPRVEIEPARPTHRAVITAAADISGFVSGSEFGDAQAIGQAFHSRAKNMAVGKLGKHAARAPVMTIERSHAITLTEVMSDEQLASVLAAATDVATLIAAGGWCAPSTILYSLFNISSDDGMWDVPTVGITRGGLKFPTSPALADFLADIWLWTEDDDIAAATGSPTKDCVRVPCPDFDDVRMEAFGLCVTAGMLTDASYPEATVNFIKLLMDAHRHVMNASHIAAAAALAVAVNMTQPAGGAAANLLSGIELQAIDYREKFGMADDSVLEVVLPRWGDGPVRADLARRSGIDFLGVTDEQIRAWFDVRDVRVQWVADYQTRGAGIGGATPSVAWPATIKGLIYAAGTLALGEGPSIDTGAIRDSVLNSTNDFTAAWTEETSLVAKLGHEVREMTLDACADGSTGAHVAQGCPIA